MCGALVAVGSMLELFVYEIQPAQAKSALAGYDKADKAAMIKAASMQYGRKDLSSHEADSIGIALAGAAIYKREMLEARA
jgi:Holliday junction resolvasome RuvABC endonuclease subunit